MKSFRNNAHRTVFLGVSRNMNRSNYAVLAALYLLTADSRLWNQVKNCVQHNQLCPVQCCESSVSWNQSHDTL